MAAQPHSDGRSDYHPRSGAGNGTNPQPDEPIRLRGELTLGHLVKAQLMIPGISFNKWTALFAAVFFAAIPWIYLGDKSFWVGAAGCWFLAIGAFVLFWFSPQLDAALVRSHLSRQFKANLPVSIELRPDGVFIATPDTETIVAWSTFHRMRESKDMILLFHRGMAQFQIVPREFCESDQQWIRLREYLGAKFPAG